MTVYKNSGPILRRNRPPNEKRLCTRETLIKIHYNHIGGAEPPLYSYTLFYKRLPCTQAFFVRGRFLLKIGPEFL